MPVEPWFAKFKVLLMAQAPRSDWPEGRAEFWEYLQRSLAQAGPMTFDLAREALDRVQLKGLPFNLERLPKMLFDELQDIFKARNIVKPVADSRDDAERLSLDCDDCGGKTGLATRYRRKSRGPGVAPTVQLYCRCPMGRWLERAHREGLEESRAIRRRIPDLLDHPDFWDAFRDPPGLEDYRERYPDVATIRARMAANLQDRFDRNRAPRPASKPLVEPAPNVYQTEAATPEEVEALRRKVNRTPSSPPPSPEPVESPWIGPGDPDWPPF